MDVGNKAASYLSSAIKCSFDILKESDNQSADRRVWVQAVSGRETVVVSLLGAEVLKSS